MAGRSIVLSGCDVEEAVGEARTLVTAFREAAGESEPSWLWVVDRAVSRIEEALTLHQARLGEVEAG